MKSLRHPSDFVRRELKVGCISVYSWEELIHIYFVFDLSKIAVEINPHYNPPLYVMHPKI